MGLQLGEYMVLVLPATKDLVEHAASVMCITSLESLVFVFSRTNSGVISIKLSLHSSPSVILMRVLI